MRIGNEHRFNDNFAIGEDFENSTGYFYDSVLSSLSRRDQRATARMYLRGLLCTEGRKSARNIAALFESSAAVEQKLQHFVSGSTWDWRPVRAALAREVSRRTFPYAYVVRSMVAPKGGGSTADDGRRATSTWAVSTSGCVPVNWRLFPSGEEPYHQQRGGSGDLGSAAVRSGAQGAIDTFLAVRRWGVPSLPLVFDGVEPNLASVVRALDDRPWLARVPAGVVLAAHDHRLGSRRGDLLAARDIVDILRRTAQVRLSTPADRSTGSVERSVAAVVAVRAPWAGNRELALFGEQSLGRPATTRLWLTNMRDISIADLLLLTRAPAVVADDVATIGDRVGLLDYFGRSLAGWHRHVTLASVAHAAIVLFDAAQPGIPLSVRSFAGPFGSDVPGGRPDGPAVPHWLGRPDPTSIEA
ncbi:transposase [Actinosynnema sp. NPDC059797]